MTDTDPSNRSTTRRRTDSSRNPIEELADEFVERLRRGEYPSVSEYASQRPDLAEEIRVVLTTLAMLENCSRDPVGG